ncbi:hypothetical protein [Roseovarius sp. 2305UL8-3]|uniref:hypothetical protein n=1 Tax=Roseovarius conchicola TaxID=3121636 RepID=UPI0035293870
MKQALFCSNCDTRLTHWLAPIATLPDMLSQCDFDSNGGDKKYQLPLVPAGHALIMRTAQMRYELFERALYAQMPEADSYINPNDLLDPILWTEKVFRLSGCCGVSGIDGPTNICKCRKEIGTTQADCWTWLVFVPQSSNTYWKNND